jgi:hypothetical protein
VNLATASEVKNQASIPMRDVRDAASELIGRIIRGLLWRHAYVLASRRWRRHTAPFSNLDVLSLGNLKVVIK